MRKPQCALSEPENDITLCEVLDRLLHKGAVISGDITISVADIDLLYVGLRLIVTSIETALAAGVNVPEKTRHAIA